LSETQNKANSKIGELVFYPNNWSIREINSMFSNVNVSLDISLSEKIYVINHT